MAKEASTKAMKALICTAFGPPKDTLKLTSAPIPTLPIDKPTKVLVKVLYASLNPIDYKIVIGSLGPASPRKPPYIPGKDFSGIVVAKGSESRLNIGDLVYGNYWQTFAEYAVIDDANVHKMPQSLDPLQAASIPLVAQTSYQFMLKVGLKKTDKLLILGGSTAVGLMGIQIAKNVIGCSEVIVTSSQIELCTSFGADKVINYRKEKWFQVLKNYNVDAIYDCVGGVEYWQLCQSEGVLKKDGHFVTLVGDQIHGGTFGVKRAVGFGMSIVNRKFWSAVGSAPKYDVILTDATKHLSEITSWVDSGKLKPVLDKESPFAFDDWLKMFDKSMAHKARGKLVMKIGDDEERKGHDDDDIVSNNQNESKQPSKEVVDNSEDKKKGGDEVEEVKETTKEETAPENVADAPKNDNDEANSKTD